MTEKIKSPVTGLVLRIVASVDSQLKAGTTIVLAEAMKVEIPITMPRDGRVRSILVHEQHGLTEGQVVAEIE